MKLMTKTIEEIQDEKIAIVDATVERLRQRFLTPGSAMMAVYLAKEAEARAYLANPAIDPLEIAHILAEATETGVSLGTVAESVLQTAAQWRTVSSRLEGKRMALKKAIRETNDPVVLSTILTVDWEAVLAGLAS